jgi:hypothetical protein
MSKNGRVGPNSQWQGWQLHPNLISLLMVKINGGSTEPDQHSLHCCRQMEGFLDSGRDGRSADLGDMCLVSLASGRGAR